MPKDHLAVAMQKSGSDLRAGSYYTYQYDGIGNRMHAVGRSNYGGATTYSYNKLNQITERNNPGVIHVSGYAPADHTVLVNNRPTVRDGEYYLGVIDVDNDSGPVSETVVVTVVEHTAQGDNPSETCFMAIVPKAIETITYDSRGNKLTDSVHTSTWDLKNRLIAVQTNEAIADDAKVRVEFEYDALDRRTQKKVYSWDQVEEDWELEKTIKFVWDGWLLIAELDASDDLVRSYIWGLDKSGTMQVAGGIGGLLAIEDHVAEKTYWVASDHNGNVMNVVDAADQSVVAAYEYSPYGELLTADGDFAAENPFRFSTKYYDAEVGLYYFGYRYYSPADGRWLNRDPIAEDGGFNLYAFVGNQPNEVCDATGLAGGVPSTYTYWMNARHRAKPNENAHAKIQHYFAWNVAGQAALGPVQGTLNIANGLQDSAIGLTNLTSPTMHAGKALRFVGVVDFEIPGLTADIPSPNWSKDKIVHESDMAHSIGKFSGSFGVETLSGMWIAKLGLLGKVGQATKATKATTISDDALRLADDSATLAGNASGVRRGQTANQIPDEFWDDAERWVATRFVDDAPSGVVLDDVVGVINHNADVATELARRAAARGRITSTPQAFGTRAHLYFERLNGRLNSRLVGQGSTFRVVAEEFRDAAGVVTSRRARGSIGADAIIRNADDISVLRNFDLKTHGGIEIPISPSRQGQFSSRFGAQAEELFRQR